MSRRRHPPTYQSRPPPPQCQTRGAAPGSYIALTQLPEVTKLLTYRKGKLEILRNRISNPFYKDVINALVRFVKDHKPTNDEILTESIWFSDHAGFPRSIIKEWDKRGLRFIGDIFDPYSGCLYSKQYIKEIYNIEMTVLCYERLIRELPQSLTSSRERHSGT